MLLGVALSALLFGAVAADEVSHRFEPGELVPLWVTKVGPYYNPQEVYSFYTIPYCAPEAPLEPRTKFAGLGEVLDGTEWVNSDLPVRFTVDVPHTPYCSMSLDEDTAAFLDFAVANHYWYQMYIDDLPAWGLVGEIVKGKDALQHLREHGETFFEEAHMLGSTDSVHQVSLEEAQKLADSAFMFAHKRFDIAYNGDRIIEVNLTSDEPQHIEPGKSFDLSYSVFWHYTSRPFESRFQRYLDDSFFEHNIHWFSLFNSFVMVVFLCGIVAFILLRTVQNDFARYMKEEEDLESLDQGVGEDNGWKRVHGDVFRAPPRAEFLAALLGSGSQLILMALGVVLVAFAGSLYVARGAITTAMLAVYSLTAVASGYTSGAFYRNQFFPRPAPQWKFVMFLTACLLPCLAAIVMLGLNVVAMTYRTLNSISFGHIAMLGMLWLLLALPLTVLGSLLGRQWSGRQGAPRRVNPVSHPLPEKPWYISPEILAIGSGVLPFGSILIETYFVFTSFWGYKFYYVYGFMLLVLVMLTIVTACVSVVVTYLLLNAEDYRWQWTSFLSGASVGLYVFVYATYYFAVKTNMHGPFQTVFYFGYTILFCSALAIATGSVGYFAASSFVRVIYTNIKVD